MLARIIAEPSPPENAPRDAQCSENPEGCSPSCIGEDRRYQQWSHCAAKTRAHEHDAVGRTPLPFREPVRKTPRHVGKSPGLSGTEKKSCGQEGDITPDQTRRHCESGPPQYNTR